MTKLGNTTWKKKFVKQILTKPPHKKFLEPVNCVKVLRQVGITFPMRCEIMDFSSWEVNRNKHPMVTSANWHKQPFYFFKLIQIQLLEKISVFLFIIVMHKNLYDKKRH